MTDSKKKLSFSNVGAAYGAKQVLTDVNLEIPGGCIFAFIGPSGCGKTTLLRSINRLNDFIRGFMLTGDITLGGENIYDISGSIALRTFRAKMGMVFQRPNPLPSSVMNNMTMPYLENNHASKALARDMAVERLKFVGLYDEISDRLNKSAMALSGGQQQRLCIARTLMLPGDMILMDEPCSALDPVSTMRIEDILLELKNERTIIMVTHNLEQARRISDYTAFFYGGKMVEAGTTQQIFTTPQEELTHAYITGRM